MTPSKRRRPNPVARALAAARPAAQIVRSKRVYRRRPKHPKRGE